MNPAASLFNVTGKAAIVTGASYGLGVTMAETLAQAGARVALVARSADKLQGVAENIRKQGGTAEVVTCDDFKRVGSMKEAKSHGVYRLEGKSYVVQDGDIMHILAST